MDSGNKKRSEWKTKSDALTEKILLSKEIQHVKGLAGVLRVFVRRSFELVRLRLGAGLRVVHSKVVD